MTTRYVVKFEDLPGNLAAVLELVNARTPFPYTVYRTDKEHVAWIISRKDPNNDHDYIRIFSDVTDACTYVQGILEGLDISELVAL